MKGYSNVNDLLASNRDRINSVNAIKLQKQQPSKPPANKRRRTLKKIRILPLVTLGLINCALIIAFGCLIWSIIAYFGKVDVTRSIGGPLIIFFIAVLISSAFITLIIRGGNIFPAFTLAIIAFIANLVIINNFGIDICISTALLKLFIILLAAIIGFSIGKILSTLLYKKKPLRKIRSVNN